MRFSFKSIRFQIIAIIVSGVLLTTIVISVLLKVQLEKSLLATHNFYAKNIVYFLKLDVASQYRSILYHKNTVLELRKSELKDMTEMVKTMINNHYIDYLNGEISEDLAKEFAIKDISKLRHTGNDGYFWINDTSMAYPKMIYHPIMKELNGKILNDTIYNCTIGKKENLFRAFIKVCMQNGCGYVNYLWTKPSTTNIAERQAKISYVTLFKPWGWIIGTGLYIDDLQKDVDKKLNSVIDGLNSNMNKFQMAKNSYGYIFNSKGELLVHKYFRGDTTILKRINKLTGNTFFYDFTTACKNKKNYVDYMWVKPGDTTNYVRKRTYITYFKELDWYIASSFYVDDIYAPIHKIIRHIVLSISVLLLLVLIISLIFTHSVTYPIMQLSKQVEQINRTDTLREIKPLKGDTELSKFSKLLNKMILSIQQTQKELEIAKQKAEESNKLKSAFLANMSHEIRTPMNGIVGFAELLTNETLEPEEYEKYTEIIKSSSLQLLSIVNDIIDISKIEAGHIKLNLAEFNLNSLCQELNAIYSDKVNSSGIKFITEVDKDSDKTIITDGTKLRQVLENLISNAIKFTEKGYVKLRCEFIESDIVFSVEDTGIGIEKSMQKKIFDRFMQADNVDEIKLHNGTGLGLAISKAYVELMHGTIHVESTIGVGSKFYFRIPVNNDLTREITHSQNVF